MKIKLPHNVGICIQGPTNHHETRFHWSQFDCPIVWSTWETEPARNILDIHKSGIEIILSSVPNYSGYLNYNMQSVSTLAGLKRLEELGVTHVLKVRGDTILGGLEWLWPEIIGCDIAFMASYNPKCSYPAWPGQLSYWLDGVVHSGFDFVTNYGEFGRTDTMIHVFGGYEPFQRPCPVPPESLLLKRWLDYRGLKHDFTPEYLKRNGMVLWKSVAKELIRSGRPVQLFSFKTGEEFIGLNDSLFITQ